MMNGISAPNPYLDGVQTNIKVDTQPRGRFNPDVEMWREAYLKEYHSHMLTFKVLRQAEYDLECAKKDIEALQKQLAGVERNFNEA